MLRLAFPSQGTVRWSARSRLSRLLSALPIIAFALVIAGCHHDDDSTIKQMAEGQRAIVGDEKGTNPPATDASATPAGDLPKGDPNTPDSKYVALTGEYQVAVLFFALSNLPPDYTKLTELASREYRTTTDAFRKRGLGQALKPDIDQKLAAFKDSGSRYFTSTLEGGLPLEHYDFATKSFPLNAALAGNIDHFFGRGGYRFAFTNGSGFRHLPVADEKQAKEIEQLITSGRIFGGHVTTYSFAQAADTTANRIKMQILKLVLTDRNGQEVGRILLGQNPDEPFPEPPAAGYQFRQ